MRRRTVAALAVLNAASLAAFPTSPDVNVPVGEAPGDQAVVKITPASDGGCWLGWFDNRAGSYAVYVQKLDHFGNEQLPHNGGLVSAHPQNSSLIDWDLQSDGAGGCVAAFTDVRDGGDLDVFAYRVSTNTSTLLPWGDDGVQISANTNFDADPRITRLSTGDFVVVYARLATAGGAAPGLVMQRLDAFGAKQLGADGVVIAGDGVEAPAFCEIVATDDGSVIVVWIRDTRTFQSPRHVRCQKFNANGAPLWNAGQPIILSANSVPIAHRPRVALNDLGSGAFFAWHDSSQGVSNAFMQHVLGSGVALFPGGALPCTAGTGMQHFDPAMAVDPLTGAVTVFLRQTNPSQSQSGLIVQRISFGGSRLFGDAGINILPPSSDGLGGLRAMRAAPGPAPSGEGATLAYSRNFFGSADSGVYAARVDQNGAQPWGAHVRLSPTTGGRFRVGLAMAANGVGRVCWEGDTRSAATSPDVYAQNINPNGTLGACAGDGNFDAAVNFADLNNVLSQFGQSGPFLSGDVNGDGVVNFADLNIVLSNFGLVCV